VSGRARTLKSGFPTEDSEQISLVEWIRAWESTILALQNFAAVPNGGKRAQQRDAKGNRFSIEAARLKRMGVSAGYPDTLLDVPVAPWHGLRIEMKSLDPDARTSADQREWIVRLTERGYYCEVCRGWVDAAGAIVRYLRPLYEIHAFDRPHFDSHPPVRPEFMRFAASVPRW
jgi:hypothetical protein